MKTAILINKLKILKVFFLKNKGAISKSAYCLALYKGLTVGIPTTDDLPTNTAHYRVPLIKQQYANDHVKELLENDII